MHGAGARGGATHKDTRQHPLYVGVQDGQALAKGETEHGASSVAPNAGEGRYGLERIRKNALVTFHHLAGRLMQVVRPAVIAQSLPGIAYLVERGRGQSRHRRETGQETPVILQHALDLRLLEHHLRD